MRRTRLWVAVISCLVFLTFFKPLVAFRTYTALDDLCYESWVARLFFVAGPSCIGSSHPPGSALAWMPAGVIAAATHWTGNSDFFEVLPIWVGLLSFSYWVGALWLLASEVGPGAGLVALLNVPVLYYCTHRTTLVHAPELFFCLLSILAVRRGRAGAGSAIGFLVVALRLNDFPALWIGLRAGAGAGAGTTTGTTTRSRAVWVAGFLAFLSILAFLAWLALIHGYHSLHVGSWLKRLSLSRLAWLLMGGDWGLLWTAPCWLSCLVLAAARFKRLSSAARIALAWMLIEALICWGWKGNGSDFAYRYLIGSYAGAYLIWQETVPGLRPRLKATLHGLAVAAGIWLTWLTWVYKELPEVTPMKDAIYPWTHPQLLSNSLELLGHTEAVGLALGHSVVGALYWTLADPLGAFALPGGPGGAQFWIAGSACAVAAGLLVACSRALWLSRE